MRRISAMQSTLTRWLADYFCFNWVWLDSLWICTTQNDFKSHSNPGTFLESLYLSYFSFLICTSIFCFVPMWFMFSIITLKACAPWEQAGDHVKGYNSIIPWRVSIKKTLISCVWVFWLHVWMFTMQVSGTCWDHQIQIPWNLSYRGLWAIWVLRARLGASVRTARTNHCLISPDKTFFLIWKKKIVSNI